MRYKGSTATVRGLLSFLGVGRRVDLDHLCGAAEIADRLNLSSPQRVREFQLRYDDFPKPMMKLTMGNLFHWPAVEKWAKAHNRPVKPKDEWKQTAESV